MTLPVKFHHSPAFSPPQVTDSSLIKKPLDIPAIQSKVQMNQVG